LYILWYLYKRLPSNKREPVTTFWKASTRVQSFGTPAIHAMPIEIFGYFIQVSFNKQMDKYDRLCGLVVRVLGYRSGGPGSIPGTTRKKTVVDLERGPLSLLSTTEELLDRKVAAPV
jgi:hypothetical protein